MDLMNHMLMLYSDSFLIILNDDILVYFENREQHEQHMRIVLHILRDQRLYVKFTKCEFWLESTVFLGHVVSNDDIMVDPMKIEAVHSWVRPTIPIKVHSFIRLAGNL
ncbi:hypothetical protein MTR67_030803 [Solanum verrucosum]|uniref:Reverse transcriptase domain-containing protein n=1 Tax=Solanum verrucosum TaxID=315347 RepID=A0AAF0U1A8_SOLVR|nr:hypothetical protein MTR67_030803 [Solanum verrucosum]